MKTVDFFWDHPLLKPYTRSIAKDEFLFRQGDPGKAMVIVKSGIIELVAEKNGKLHPITYIEAGSFLGEQAIVGEEQYSRVFTARALTDLTVIELDRKIVDFLKTKAPELVIDILRATFKVSSDRLNQANRLMGLLRSSNNTERFLYLLLHFSTHQGRVVPEGKEIVLNFDTIRFYIDMTDFSIQELLEELCRRKTLLRKDEHIYVIRNEKALLDQIPALRDDIALPPVL